MSVYFSCTYGKKYRYSQLIKNVGIFRTKTIKMRKLNYLKQCAVFAIAVIALGGCMSDEEQSFGFAGATAYVVQTNYPSTNEDGNTRSVFTPYINFACNDVIASASLKKGEESYMLSYVDDSNNQMMQIGGYGGILPTDTIPNGVYQLVATDAAGSPATLSITFNLKKKLGVLNVTELKYGGGSEITGKWDEVDNANVYYLVIKSVAATTAGKTFIPWDDYTPNVTSGSSYPHGLVTGESYSISVAAAYIPKSGEGTGILIVESNPVLITWGTPLVQE